MKDAPPIRVVHYHRKPYGGYFSIERVFAAIRQKLPGSIDCRVVECRFTSRSLFRRLWNLLEAPFHQGQVNHITGDVHYLAALLPKKRTILTVHDCGTVTRARGLRRFIYKLVWFQMPMWRSGVIVAISDATRRELEQIAPAFAHKIIVIPDPLVDGFTPSPKEFYATEPTILHIGTAPNKNLERVAEALEGLRCRMEIVGELSPGQKSALARFGIQYSNSSRLTDEQMVEKYRSADLVEFCSTYEGFGMPIIEANSIGRPVVTSRLEPMAWVAGNAACVVDPLDPSSIRAGILRVIEDTPYREELVRLGRENARRFTAEAAARLYVECYQRIAAER
jgi:glycosyltransferase involved in cell wall biosynthesis